MKSKTIDIAQVMKTVESLRAEVARLGERVAALEKQLAEASGRAASHCDPVPVVDGLSEELVLVIGAAIAAFLGVKPHIRQIRLLGGHPWSQQGRVTIQASHVLNVHHS